jgi:predicted aspartyl protease
MNFRYSSSYYPPAPIIEISFVVPSRKTRIGPLTGYVDTGADATLVPVTYLRQVRAPSTEERFLRSHWGERRSVILFAVNIEIGGLVVSNVEVVGDDQSDEILIGRDVLNQLHIHLNGPGTTLEIT